MSEEWNLKPSQFANTTVNPLRVLWERNQPKANPLKSSIILQSGDPTAFGNFPPYQEVVEALSEALQSDTFSYEPCNGIEKSRAAVAEYCKHMGELTAKDVILTTGCSMALEMCIVTLAGPGENILIPRPSWNYMTLTRGPKVEARLYNLDPMDDWSVDLEHMESLIDSKTRAILVNNPGNPCGNVFSKEHILDIIAIAERHKLPIISDEIYEFLVLPGAKFHSFATLSKNVPILVCSGLTKRFSLPGIRCDWIIINDRGNKLADIRVGFANVAGRNFYPNTTVQKALPRILKCVPETYFQDTREKVEVSAFMIKVEIRNSGKFSFTASRKRGIRTSEDDPRTATYQTERFNVYNGGNQTREVSADSHLPRFFQNACLGTKRVRFPW